MKKSGSKWFAISGFIIVAIGATLIFYYQINASIRRYRTHT